MRLFGYLRGSGRLEPLREGAFEVRPTVAQKFSLRFERALRDASCDQCSPAPPLDPAQAGPAFDCGIVSFSSKDGRTDIFGSTCTFGAPARLDELLIVFDAAERASLVEFARHVGERTGDGPFPTECNYELWLGRDRSELSNLVVVAEEDL